MAGGYNVPATGDFGELIQRLTDMRSQIDELAAPSGTQTANALQQIRDLVDGIITQTNLTVPGYMSAGTSMSAGTTITAGGNVTSSGGTFVSPYARSHSVVASYVAAYIDGSGNFLSTPSTRRLKRDIVTATWSRAQRDAIRVVYYRLRAAFIIADMAGDSDDAETLVGVIGEELIEAGFPEFVVLDDKGRVFTVRYEMLALIALDGLQQAEARIDDLEARLDAAGI